MRLHFVGTGLAGLAWQAARGGARVTAWLGGGPGRGLGFSEVPTPEPVGRTDAVLVDLPAPSGGAVAADLARRGHRVLFAGRWADVLASPEGRRRLLAGTPLDAPEGPEGPVARLVGGWWDGGWQGRFFEATVRHRLLAGDYGPVTWRGGAEARATDAPEAAAALERLTPVARASDYRGLLGWRVEARADGAPALADVAAGLGDWWPVLPALAEIAYGGLLGVVQEAPWTLGDDVAASVGMSLPPWPYACEDAPAAGWTLARGAERHLWPEGLRREGEAWLACDAWLGYVSARGRAGAGAGLYREAAGRAYRTVREMAASVPSLQCRDDVGIPPRAGRTGDARETSASATPPAAAACDAPPPYDR